MRCEETVSRLSELVDDALSEQQRLAVEKHLQECATCRAQWQQTVEMDRQLRRLRVDPALSERITNALQGQQNSLSTDKKKHTLRSRLLGAVAVAAALAACVAIAFFNRPPMQTITPASGIVSTSIGNVQVWSPDTRQWRALTSTSVTLFAGTRVRTAEEASCEIVTTDQSRLRLNSNTEVALDRPGRLQVSAGQVWCRASDTNALMFESSAGGDGAAATMDIPAFRCPSASEAQVTVEPVWSCVVENGTSTTPGNLEKIWQLPLLAAAGQDNEELISVLEPVLANIGRTKATHLSETQIRALGPRGAIPLLTYATSAASQKEPNLRWTAVRIGCKLADKSAERLLKQLQSDEDENVTSFAAEALKRLNLGY